MGVVSEGKHKHFLERLPDFLLSDETRYIEIFHFFIQLAMIYRNSSFSLCVSYMFLPERYHQADLLADDTALAETLIAEKSAFQIFSGLKFPYFFFENCIGHFFFFFFN